MIIINNFDFIVFQRLEDQYLNGDFGGKSFIVLMKICDIVIKLIFLVDFKMVFFGVNEEL